MRVCLCAFNLYSDWHLDRSILCLFIYAVVYIFRRHDGKYCKSKDYILFFSLGSSFAEFCIFKRDWLFRLVLFLIQFDISWLMTSLVLYHYLYKILIPRLLLTPHSPSTWGISIGLAFVGHSFNHSHSRIKK